MCWLVSVSYSDWLVTIATLRVLVRGARWLMRSPTQKPFIASHLFDGEIVMLFEKVRNNSDIIWCDREGFTSFYAFRPGSLCSQLLVVTL